MADTDGNISMEKEALFLEFLAIATSAHNSGGIVIVTASLTRDRYARGYRQRRHEEKVMDFLTLTAEPGVIGGLPAGG